MDKSKVIITAAVNGNRPDQDGIHVPVTPQEIAEDGYRCYQAGAAVVHFHARDVGNRRSTADARVFGDTISRLRDKCDVLIETTTGVGPKLDPATGLPILDPITGLTIKPSDDERLRLLDIEPRQDLCSIGAGSLNMYNPVYSDAVVFINSPYYIKKSLNVLTHRERSAFQFEIFDVGFLSNIERLMDHGLLARDSGKFWLNYCIGFGGLPATPRHLSLISSEGERLFPHTRWGTVTPAANHFAIAAAGAGLGADMLRTGFEDTVRLPGGGLAATNAQLIEALARIIRDAGREVASVEEARAMLNIS